MDKLVEEELAEQAEDIVVKRPPREKLTREETLRRAAAFDQRKEAFIAAIRKGARGDLYPDSAE